MIFVTVGSQMPFDRLIRTMDAWASAHPDQTIEAQIGNTNYVPQYMKHDRILTPAEFTERMAGASMIVAHAGMGTIISAMEFGRPMILLPRRGALRETRNDHQVATAKWLESKPGISVAYTEDELGKTIERILDSNESAMPSDNASNEMVVKLKGIIAEL